MIIVFFLLGACLASFGKVIIDNEDNPKHIFNGRSKCDICSHLLNAIDLIPILGRIINKGRCKYCGQKISIIYILLELLTGIAFVFIYYFFGYLDRQLYILARSMIMIIYGDIKQQTINLWFLAILVIIGLANMVDLYLVLTCFLGILLVYMLGFLVNKIKYKTRSEGMGIGDILLTVGLWLNFPILTHTIYQKFNFYPQILLSLTKDLGSQTITNIYIFLVWIVISSLYGLLMTIVYIYIIDKNKNNDELTVKIPFGPALIISFVTLLLL